MLTQEQVDRFVDCNGERCPFCDSLDTMPGGSDADGSEMCLCLECERQWYEDWALVGAGDTDGGLKATTRRVERAAPELLAACEDALHTLEFIGCLYFECPGSDKPFVDGLTCCRCDSLRQLRAAIAKAKGGMI